MLSAQGVCKFFGNREVLKNVTAAVLPGRITCLIGPSGTGKTTLLRALAFLDPPTTGTILVEDRAYSFPLPAKEKTPAPWPYVTAVFQSLFLWPHLTLRENIMLPARAVNPEAERDIEGLIALFEMHPFIDNYPNQASLGQQQRVAVARALILNPRYILLDEITSALDVEQTARILAKLGQLKERNIGVFMITHALGFARHSADQILFMDEGQIAESGGPEILETPTTDRLRQFLSTAKDMGG